MNESRICAHIENATKEKTFAGNCGGFLFAPTEVSMPMKPKRPCSYPGCPELTDGQFCAVHKKQTDADYNRYGRDSAAKRQYGRLWLKIRAQHLADHPLCEMCLREDRTTPAEEVHHKIPLRKGGTHDPGNLMSLCVSCHSRITALEGGRWG